MNRYEEILTQMVAAQIAAGHEPAVAAKSGKLREAAALLEKHLQMREAEMFLRMEEPGYDLPALLRKQAE
jgi:hypothetical protein